MSKDGGFIWELGAPGRSWGREVKRGDLVVFTLRSLSSTETDDNGLSPTATIEFVPEILVPFHIVVVLINLQLYRLTL